MTYRTITSRSNIAQHRTFLVFLRTHLYNTTRIPPIAWPIPTDIAYRAFWIDHTLSGEQHPFRHPTRQYSHHSLHISTLDDNNHANSRCVIPFDSTRSWTGTRAPVRHLAHDGTPWTSHYDSQGRPCLPDNPHSFPYPYVRPACTFSIPLTWAQAYAIQCMLFEEATSTHDAPYTRILVEIVKNTTGTVHTLLAGDVCIFSANRRWNDVSGANSHKLHTNGICLAHTPLARPGYATSGNRSKHHYADIFLTFPVPPPDSHTPQGTSYGESQYPSENRIDTVKSFSNMQSELRASAAEFPFGLRSPAALRVSPGLLLSSFGAVLLLSSSCVVLCVLICPDPSLRCCASLLLRPRPSFSLCVEAAVVCVAGGRRHEIAARTALL